MGSRGRVQFSRTHNGVEVDSDSSADVSAAVGAVAAVGGLLVSDNDASTLNTPHQHTRRGNFAVFRGFQQHHVASPHSEVCGNA